MNKITFVVNGNPVGKHRHRSAVLPNGMIHNYNSKTNQDYEKLVRWEYKRQCPNVYFIGELEVVIDAYFAIPKSWGKKKKQSALNGEFRPTTKCDIDNIEKICCDALNKIAYDDDRQIVDMHGHKWYSDEPRVEITICGEIVQV